MKLVRFGAPGKEKPGIIDSEGRIRDLSGVVPDIAGDALSPKSLAKLAKLKAEKLAPDAEAILPHSAGPSGARMGTMATLRHGQNAPGNAPPSSKIFCPVM